MTITYTRYMRFAVPDFLTEPWHDELRAAFDSLDSIIYQDVILHVSGIWTNSTPYTIGNIVISPDDGLLYTAAVNHTSSAAPTTFTQERVAHPTFWSSFAPVIATQAEAIAGVEATHYMTPATTKAAILQFNVGTVAVVVSLNGLSGVVSLSAGTNITITPKPGNLLEIAATGGGGSGGGGTPLIIAVQKFTSSGTYTPTVGMVYAIIECIGGGGGGGGVGSAAGFYYGGGGGSGGYSRATVTGFQVGTSKSVTVGAAGAGASGGTTGGAGGDTAVGSLCIAKGGSGGTAGSDTANYGKGGAGGVVAGGAGDIVGAGAPGEDGMFNNAGAVAGAGGGGGSSAFGGGAAPSTGTSGTSGNGAAATNYGSGGGGAFNSSASTARDGGAGSAGFVIITEYIGGALAVNSTSINIQKFTTSGTYIPTLGMQFCIIECIGGGGGGGAANATGAFSLFGGAGGSGGYSRKISNAATVGVSQTVTVGSGGSGGIAGGAAAGNGGVTSFGALCAANGGNGGQLTDNAVQLGNGGLGGSPSTGDISAAGNAGANGAWTNTANTIPGNAGYGPGSALGGGVRTSWGTTATGTAGGNYGAGGAGGFASTGSATGGAGAAGIVIVTEYIYASTNVPRPFNINRQVFTASGTYTPTPGLIYADVECIGGGGGGGGVVGTAANYNGGGGGGSGAYSRKVLSVAAIGASQSVTVGASGSGVGGGSDGAAGGDSFVGASIGAALCGAKGGLGGKLSSSGTPAGIGGAGGSTTGGVGDVVAAGAPGGNGTWQNSGTQLAGGGEGGSSILGGGAIGVFTATGASSVAGTNAFNYGSGGGGAFSNGAGSTQAGGNGSAGIVIITEYLGGDAPLTAAYPRGYIDGFILANNVSNTKLDVNAGACRDDANIVNVLSQSLRTIDCGTTGANGLDSGTLANNTMYNAFVIMKVDGTIAVFASTSPTPTLPVGYNYKRRLGSFRTDGSAHILPFTQIGNRFYYTTSMKDFDSSALTTSRSLATLSVPPNQISMIRYNAFAGASVSVTVQPTFEADAAIGFAAAPGASLFAETATVGGAAGETEVQVDGASQIAIRSSVASTTARIFTRGWIDSRGQNA